MKKSSLASNLTCALLVSLNCGLVSAAQPVASGYEKPAAEILSVMHAPSPPVPVVSPGGDSILLVSWEDYPSIARVSRPFLRLAGVRLEPQNHSKHDTPGGYGITLCARAFELVNVEKRTTKKISLRAEACPGTPLWSADGRRFAFANITAKSVELWIGEATTGKVHRVPRVQLNPIFGDEIQWMPDQKNLLVKLVPQKMGPPPPEPLVPSGPSVQESDGKKGQSSTYENRDTLGNKHDEDLFDHYASSQLAFVNAGTSAVRLIGKPALYDALAPSPDAEYLLLATLHSPYSYVTTYDRFPREIEVWKIADLSRVTRQTITSRPLADRVPISGVPTGPRDFSWRANVPATLVWAEALDGGDWNVKVPARDKVMMLKAPFDGTPVEVTRLEQRFEGFEWGEQTSLALLSEWDRNRHWTKTFALNVDEGGSKPRLLWDFSTDEHYAHPGSPVHRSLASGMRVLRQDGAAIYLAGQGSSPDGDRPFLDRLNLETLKSERLFRSDKTSYEKFFSFSGPDATRFLTWRQSPEDPPNAFLHVQGAALGEAGSAAKDAAAKEATSNQKKDAAASSQASPSKDASPAAREATFASTSEALTHISDPTPEVRQIKKRLVHYKRADGLDLSFTLYTPPGYKEGTRVPAILYAYPLDYAESSKAGQVTGSEMTFTQLKKYRLALLAGYAIIDNAAFPIVGDPKKAYDTYMEQLVADAKAAVDEAVKLGVVDPNRIGITGHSHGALMTVNLLAHSKLFKAGVATSGSYNKTLTPFGFQSEQRSVWEAPEVYRQVSPFFSADVLKTPLLIVHGTEDANPGTTPLQATKLFEAVRGNGGTTRLVMLPHEPHWYTAMESNEDLVAEMLRWFDKYVKNAP